MLKRTNNIFELITNDEVDTKRSISFEDSVDYGDQIESKYRVHLKGQSINFNFHCTQETKALINKIKCIHNK